MAEKIVEYTSSREFHKQLEIQQRTQFFFLKSRKESLTILDISTINNKQDGNQYTILLSLSLPLSLISYFIFHISHFTFLMFSLFLILLDSLMGCVHERDFAYIEECIFKKQPLTNVLKLLCTVCLTGCVKQKQLEFFQKEILQVSNSKRNNINGVKTNV
jgi:hypothetical protein